MTTITDYTTTTEQAVAAARVIAAAERDLGEAARVVAYSMDPGRGYVTLACGRHEVVVLQDGTLAEEVPA